MSAAGTCRCGCGEVTAVATSSDAKRGHVKGQPLAFVRGHNSRLVAREDAELRFWAKVDKTVDCWNWTASTRRGYGRFQPTRDTSVQAHRYAYEALVGPIPGDLTLDHLCRNKTCVNPAHLEPVSRGENSRRGAPSVITNRCKWNHEFTPENTYVRPDGARMCRACHRSRQAARRAA